MKRWLGRWMTWDYQGEHGRDFTGDHVKFWYKRKMEWRESWPPLPVRMARIVFHHQWHITLFQRCRGDNTRRILSLSFDINLPTKQRP